MSDLDILKSKELTLCGNCKRSYNGSTLQPKYLSCKHYFCLECIQNGFNKSHGSHAKPNEIYCLNCWKLTDLSEGGAEYLETYEPALSLANCFDKLRAEPSIIANGVKESEAKTSSDYGTLDDNNEKCLIHAKPLKLWCINCEVSLCHECATQEHCDINSHTLWTEDVAKDEMKKQANSVILAMNSLDDRIQQLSTQQRRFLVMIRNALAAVKNEVQSNLDNVDIHWGIDPRAAEIRRSFSRTEVLLKDANTPMEVHGIIEQLLIKQNFLKEKYQEMVFLCKLNDLVGNSSQVFNFDSIRHAVDNIIEGKGSIIGQSPPSGPDPILFLANYCMSQLYSRSVNNTNIPNENDSVQILFNRNGPDIPLNVNELLTEPIPEPQLSTCSSFSTFSNPPDIPNHSSVAPSATPQRINSPVPQQEEPPISPTPRTSAAAQMFPIESSDTLDPPNPLLVNPLVRPVKMKPLTNSFPRYFFTIEINGIPRGRFVIETRPDVAPKMCRNFDRLSIQEGKMSYRGCNFFQCWKGESVITGDYEMNTGRGGKSIYEDNFFMPDETRFPAIRGAVGMRRQQKGHENFGLVGSQFRIVLQDMQGFTGIFGHVVEGIELIDKIASYGDNTGKPSRPIVITRCGKLEFK